LHGQTVIFFITELLRHIIYANMRQMRKIHALCFVLCIMCAGLARADEWLPNFEDIPKMEKTYIVEDEGFVYSQPDGKIAQTTVASDEVTRRQFQRFYRDALDELGWKNIKDNRSLQIFTRRTEELRIEVTNTEPLSVRITLTPK
jgi:hypothetical protein